MGAKRAGYHAFYLFKLYNRSKGSITVCILQKIALLIVIYIELIFKSLTSSHLQINDDFLEEVR